MSRELDNRKIREYYTPEDAKYIDHWSNEQAFMAPRNFIAQLDSEKVGRAIINQKFDEDEELVEEKKLGYILPVKREFDLQDKHLVLFSSGDMLVAECLDSSAQTRATKYESHFSVNAVPWVVEDIDNPLGFMNFLKRNAKKYNAKISYSSDNIKELSGINANFAQAMKRIEEVRFSREQGRVNTDKLLNATTIFKKDSTQDQSSPHKK